MALVIHILIVLVMVSKMKGVDVPEAAPAEIPEMHSGVVPWMASVRTPTLAPKTWPRVLQGLQYFSSPGSETAVVETRIVLMAAAAEGRTLAGNPKSNSGATTRGRMTGSTLLHCWSH